MTIKLNAREYASSTMDGFVHFLETDGVIGRLRNSKYDIDDMNCLAARLYALAASKDNLLNHIIAELEEPTRFQIRNNGQSQGFILYRTPYYTIRLMIWIPAGPQAKPTPFSYESAHDHAFDLMSVGFFGPGYRTSLYSFDYNDPIRSVDGLTRLDYKGDEYLREGEVIYYFANQDVHVQHAPISLSASLNLIIVKPNSAARQTVFDLQEDSSSGNVAWGKPRFNSQSRLVGQRSIFSVLSMHGNARSRLAMAKIARDHELEEVKALAWAALLQGKFSDPHLHAELAEEKSTFVKNIVTGYRLKRERLAT